MPRAPRSGICAPRLRAVGFFRRRPILNERQLHAEPRKQTLVQPDAISAPDEALAKNPTDAAAEVLGGYGVGIGGRQEDPWDVFVFANAPEIDCDEVLFWALPYGALLVAERGTANVSSLADAVEEKLQRPYKALASRQDETRWAIAATQIVIARFAFAGHSLEVERDGATQTFTVDGKPSSQPIPKELEAVGENAGSSFYVAAERIDGDIWDVRVA
jgi:hypothetical protein